jgi:cell volume regulation protein A
MHGAGLLGGLVPAAVNSALAPGTNLPRGFFLMISALYILSLLLHRLAIRFGFPSAPAILLLGLSVNLILGAHGFISHAQVETLHTLSLALLLFYAGLNTDLSLIRGLLPFALLLPTAGVLITGLTLGSLLWAFAALNLELPLLQHGGLNGSLTLGAALLTAVCLLPTDASTTAEMLEPWHGRVSPGSMRLLDFEAALSSAAALLCFDLVTWVFQGASTGALGGIPTDAVHELPTGLAVVLAKLFGGIAAGLFVGVIANRLIPLLVRHSEQLLLLAVAVAFMAYAAGTFLGGGGMVAVYVCGLLLANRPHGRGPFGHTAMLQALLPFDTAAEFALLLLLGRLVNPADLMRVLPLGILVALLLEVLLRPLVVWLLSGRPRRWSVDRIVVSAGGLRSTLPVALSFALLEQVPRLRNVAAQDGEALATDLQALVFVVVVAGLLLKGVLLPRLLGRVLGPLPPRAEVPLGTDH